MQNLKDTYKRAKENNKKAGASFFPSSVRIDKILGCEDIVNLPQKRESVVQRSSVRKVFLKISQSSQENICA